MASGEDSHGGMYSDGGMFEESGAASITKLTDGQEQAGSQVWEQMGLMGGKQKA